MIFTSYFGNVDRIKKKFGCQNDQFVEICLKSYRYGNFEKKENLVTPDYKNLMSYKKGKINWEEYCYLYYEKLELLNEGNFWTDFVERNQRNILLCYEKDFTMCHRYLLGKYLFWLFGKCKVVEIDCNLNYFKIEKTFKRV